MQHDRPLSNFTPPRITIPFTLEKRLQNRLHPHIIHLRQLLHFPPQGLSLSFSGFGESLCSSCIVLNLHFKTKFRSTATAMMMMMLSAGR